MRKLVYPFLFAGLLLVAIFGLIEGSRGQSPTHTDGLEVLRSEDQDGNVREIYGAAELEGINAPDISFIDSPTVTCYQPDPAQDACYINWYYMSVNASPSYMVVMTATINSIGPVARYHGFFQTSMYVPFTMQDRGIKVVCGELGAGGNPSLGNSYAWTINASDSANLKSANYGSVLCPAYTP